MQAVSKRGPQEVNLSSTHLSGSRCKVNYESTGKGRVLDNRGGGAASKTPAQGTEGLAVGAGAAGVSTQQLIRVFVQYFFNQDERQYFQQFWMSVQDSKETIDLQDLLKILRKWLQIEVDRNTYVEFLNIAGLLNHKAGDQLIEFQHMRVTFAQMNQSAAILAGVQCHERRCESYSSSCSSGAGTGESPTWSFPSFDMRSIDGAVGSTETSDKPTLSQADSLRSLKLEMKDFLRKQLDKALTQRGISPGSINTSKSKLSSVSTVQNGVEQSKQPTSTQDRKTKKKSSHKTGAGQPTSFDGSLLPTGTSDKLAIHDPASYVSETQRRLASLLYPPFVTEFYPKKGNQQPANLSLDLQKSKNKKDKSLTFKQRRHRADGHSHDQGQEEKRKSYHTSSPKRKERNIDGSLLQRRNSAPSQSADEASKTTWDKIAKTESKDPLEEMKQYIDKQLDRVVHESLFGDKKSSFQGIEPTPEKPKKSSAKKNYSNTVEDFSVFSADNGPSCKPLEIPMLHLRNTSSEDSEENWKNRGSSTSNWNTRSSSNQPSSAPQADRSEVTTNHKSGLFSPIYESVSIETQEEESTNNSPKLAFLTAQKIFYDPESPPSTDKLKMLKVKSEGIKQQAKSVIFRRNKKLCKTVCKVVSRTTKTAGSFEKRGGDKKDNERGHRSCTFSPNKSQGEVRDSRGLTTSSSSDEYVRNVSRLSGEKPRTAENLPSSSYASDRDASKSFSSSSNHNFTRQQAPTQKTSKNEDDKMTSSPSSANESTLSITSQPILNNSRQNSFINLEQIKYDIAPNGKLLETNNDKNDNDNSNTAEELNAPTPSFIRDFSVSSSFSDNSTETTRRSRSPKSPKKPNSNKLKNSTQIGSEIKLTLSNQKELLFSSPLPLEEFCVENEITVADQLQNRAEFEHFLDQAKTLEDSVLVECFPSTESVIHFHHTSLTCFDMTSFESPRLFGLVHGNVQWCFVRNSLMIWSTYSSTFISCQDVIPVESFSETDSSEEEEEEEEEEEDDIFPKIPDVDVDLESFADSSSDARPRDCGGSDVNAAKMASLQQLLDDLPLDCSTPKTRLVAAAALTGQGGGVGASLAGEDLTDVSSDEKEKDNERETRSEERDDGKSSAAQSSEENADEECKAERYEGDVCSQSDSCSDVVRSALQYLDSKDNTQSRSEAAKQIVTQNKKEEKEVNEFGKRGDINDDDCDEDEFRSFSDSDSDYDSPEEGLTQDQQGMATGSPLKESESSGLANRFNKLPRDQTFIMEQIADVTDSPRSSVVGGGLLKCAQNSRRGGGETGTRSVRFETESSKTDTSFHMSPSSVSKTVHVLPANGKFVHGSLNNSTSSNNGAKSGSLHEISKLKEDYELLKQALEGAVSQEASFNVSLDERIASMPERASRKLTPKRLSMSDYIERVNNSARSNRSMETYCDSSGDNNEGSVKVLAFQSLAAEVLHNNACISASGRYKKEAKDCQNQRPTNKNVSSQPSSPSLSSREESTSGSFPRNHVTSAVKGQSYNRFGRRSVVGISGASSELAGISNPQESPFLSKHGSLHGGGLRSPSTTSAPDTSPFRPQSQVTSHKQSSNDVTSSFHRSTSTGVPVKKYVTFFDQLGR